MNERPNSNQIKEFDPRQAGLANKKGDPMEIKAEDVYKILQEIRQAAVSLLDLQIKTNEKLINDPIDDRTAEEKERVERPLNPRHFPAFLDIGKDIIEFLYSTLRLQERLNLHL